MLLKRVLGVAVLCGGVLSVAVPAAAQAAVEVSGGYNYLRLEGESVPNGWYADLAGKIAPGIQLVGQVTGNYKTVSVGGIDVDAKLHSFMGGVRVAGSRTGVSPFGQVLFGVLRASASSNASGLLPFTVSDGDSEGALQIGGGLNIRSSAAIGLRLGLDYVRVLSDVGANGMRFSAGIVLGK
jgi:hypothetical protein